MSRIDGAAQSGVATPAPRLSHLQAYVTHLLHVPLPGAPATVSVPTSTVQLPPWRCNRGDQTSVRA